MTSGSSENRPNSERHAEVDLLLVDDDEEFRGTLTRRFSRRGHRVQEAAGAAQALALVDHRQFDVAIIDMVMPGMSGIELSQQLKRKQADCEVILLTGQGSVESAVHAMKLGAYDYLTKPFPLDELEILVEKAAEKRRLAAENAQLREVIDRQQAAPEMIGNSPAMLEVLHLIERVAPTDKAVLIQGESGTGKELVARAIHRRSARAEKPLVAINCAALSETLLESEFFGHEKGAFTGAIAAKPGLFELADGGTLFIDEIGEMPTALQAKLLRVLEDGSMRRVGSLKERRVNVRIVAATNRDLAREVAERRFREDLYYRINVMGLNLPPLRERAGDVALLVQAFLGAGWQIEPAAMSLIERYPWPGNIRQLRNALERAKILADEKCILVSHLPREVTSYQQQSPESGRAIESGGACTDELKAIEREHILEILRRERGNKARAAKALGISRRSLYRFLEKHGIDPNELLTS